MPVMMTFLYGYAINMDIENVILAVIDLDHTSESRELTQDFYSSTYFSQPDKTVGLDDPETILRSNKAAGVLVIKPGFGRAVERRDKFYLGLLVDGSDNALGAAVQSYAAQVVNRFQMDRLPEGFTLPGNKHFFQHQVQPGPEIFALFRTGPGGDNPDDDLGPVDLNNHRPRERNRHDGAASDGAGQTVGNLTGETSSLYRDCLSRRYADTGLCKVCFQRTVCRLSPAAVAGRFYLCFYGFINRYFNIGGRFDSATGHDDGAYGNHATVGYAKRFYFRHQEHARRLAGTELYRAGPVFPGDYPRHHAERDDVGDAPAPGWIVDCLHGCLALCSR